MSMVKAGINDLLSQYPQIAAEWHPTLNNGLMPDQVSKFSAKKVWWLCSKGHSWQATISNRTALHQGCPYCSGQKAISGNNDLATLLPEIAAEWHPKKNGDLTPSDVGVFSKKMVWWQCEKGHSWKQMVQIRARVNGCPVCSGRIAAPGVNDLATTHPELAEQWHPTKNKEKKPSQVTEQDSRKYWWICDKGHEWQAKVSKRVLGEGCPVCANRVIQAGFNDLKTLDPELAKQWHPTRNGSLRPEDVGPGSNKRVWWRCKLGHEWKAQISSRHYGRFDCPYCTNRKVLPGFNDLQTLEPKIAKQWYYPLNNGLTPEMVTPGSGRKVWWQCQDGHVWKASVMNRARKHYGCPICTGRFKPQKYDLLNQEAETAR